MESLSSSESVSGSDGGAKAAEESRLSKAAAAAEARAGATGKDEGLRNRGPLAPRLRGLSADGPPSKVSGAVTTAHEVSRPAIPPYRGPSVDAVGSQLLEDFESTAAKSVTLNRSMTEVGGTSLPGLPARQFAPQVTMDGTKLIIKLGRNDKFQFDNPCRVLLSTPRVRMDQASVWTTVATCTDNENIVVLDSGGIGQRFAPIPLSHYGTVYTKDGVCHVVIGGEVRRSKVHSRHLPYRTCNKFQGHFVEDSGDESQSQLLARQKSKQIGVLSPKKAMRVIRDLASDPHGGVVYLRGDESLVRYKVKHDDRIEIRCGQILAWTLGIRFEYKTFCCFRFVSAVLGEGTVWLCNPRRGKA